MTLISRKYRKFFKYIIALIVAASCSQIIQGDIRIIDADTIKVGQNKIRLQGIDAPETKQTCKCAGQTVYCGKIATQSLKDFVGSDKIYCEGDQRDRYGRIIGECLVRKSGQTINLNQWLVANGYAVAYKQYSKKFSPDESAAQQAKKGFWACEKFENPADFRHKKWKTKKRSKKFKRNG